MKGLVFGLAASLVCAGPPAWAASNALPPGHAAGIQPAQAMTDRTLLYIGAGVVVVGIAVGLSSGSSAASGAVAAPSSSTTGSSASSGGATVFAPPSSAPAIFVTPNSNAGH